MKTTGIICSFVLIVVLASSRAAVAAPAVEVQAAGVSIGSDDVKVVALKKDDEDKKDKKPKDKPKKSNKNDGKDGDPDDGNAGKGNDDKKLPNDGPIND